MPHHTLLDMLTYRRPAGSPTDRLFRERYLLSLPDAYLDRHGNIHVARGDHPRVLWSCHTDTVHRDGGRQAIDVDAAGIVRLADREKYTATYPIALPLPPAPGRESRSARRRRRRRERQGQPGLLGQQQRYRSTCLGADDTVGVYLMREMIQQGIPGHYIFHYGEERGGLGSSALARTDAVWLRSFETAIALDRQGTGDVVISQFGQQTASMRFAVSLAAALSAADASLRYAPSPGVYTDTAEYADVIPECTNLSVGYYGQHTADERVDTRHVDRLLGALLALDPSALDIVRDPSRDPEPDLHADRGTGYLPHWAAIGWDDDDVNDRPPHDAETQALTRDENETAYAGTGVDAPWWWTYRDGKRRLH